MVIEQRIRSSNERYATYVPADESVSGGLSKYADATANASTELQHVQQLHAEATKLVQETENKAAEYPQEMRDKWDAQHKAVIEKTAKAKTYLGMFK